MSDEQVLSQDEVEALTTAVDEGDVETETDTGSEDYAALDFKHQERIVRTQFPVLARIHERFSIKLVASLYSLISSEAEITMDEPRTQKFGEFMLSLGMPSSINTVRFHPLRGKAYIVMDASLVFSLVEKYFGGDCRFKVSIEEREFTNAEQRITQLIMEDVEANLMEAWDPIMKVTIENIGHDMNPQLVNTASSEDVMLVSQFNLKFEEVEGNFYIVIPYTALEPIREQLDLGAARADDEIDMNWVNAMQTEILDAPLDVSSTLTETELNLGEVLKMRVGDVIPVELPEEVTVNIENIPSFKAKYGISNDKCALKIIRKIQR